MLRVLVSASSTTCDAFVRILSLNKQEDTEFAVIYRRESWIFVFLHVPLSAHVVESIASTFFPDRLYFPFFGYSIDMMHEIGDVVVPNVFLSYEKSLDKAEITKENRDTLVKNPRFLSTFTEQKDYYVEDFGLSVGGIVVDDAPLDPSDDLMGKMMLAYEGDIYIPESAIAALEAVIDDQVPSLVLAGITRGKIHPKHADKNSDDLTARNIMTTITLLEEDGE